MKPVTKQIVLVAMGAGLTAVGGFIKLPFVPSHPITLQLFFILLVGALLGSYVGPLSQIAFIVLGVLGLPAFDSLATGFPAPALAVSPAFVRLGLKAGYLEGFVAAAYLIGKAIERTPRPTFSQTLLIMGAGFLVIYLLGIAHFSIVLGLRPNALFLAWALPFILLDLVKAVLAAVLTYRLKAAGL